MDAATSPSAAWASFCAAMAALKAAILAADLKNDAVSTILRIVEATFISPDPTKIAFSHAGVAKSMRTWAQAQVQTLYFALAVANSRYRLTEGTLRLFAATLIEMAHKGSTFFINNCLSPQTMRASLFADARMRALGPPEWPTAIVDGASMDPYLHLEYLVGPVTYTYLEPRPEWKERFPHLPIVILLGDLHEVRPPCEGIDLAHDRVKEVGGSHSFLRFLDSDPHLAALAPDVVFEDWLPFHLRSVATDAGVRTAHRTWRGGDPMAQTRPFVMDCVGPFRAPGCTLTSVRVHIADLRDTGEERKAGYAHLLGALHKAVRTGDKQVFADQCRAAVPGWAIEDVARSVLSLTIFEDLDNPRLRRERLAHEFYQLHEEVQAALRTRLALMPGQSYPYDLPGAVAEWLRAAWSGERIHPFVEHDVDLLSQYKDTELLRRTMSLELYALSRLLKIRRDGGHARLGVLYAGSFHCKTAAFLLHGMYNIHGAAASSAGCLDFSKPTDKCFTWDEETDHMEMEWQEPQRPITWP